MHEFDELCKVIVPDEPSLFILGGAKFETKMPLVDKYTGIYSNVFIGGALANDIFKAKGYEIGNSLVSKVDLRNTAIMNRLNILLPIDVVVRRGSSVRVTDPIDVRKDEQILDAGPRTVEMLGKYVLKAKTILWNGPLGDYEQGFSTQTEALATLIAGGEGYSLIGGGDTIAAIEPLCLQEKFSFLSTAGGAMLTFLEHGALPAIDEVLEQ